MPPRNTGGSTAGRTGYKPPVRWVPVSNQSGALIPPHAAMEVTGTDTAGRLTVRKPTVNGATSTIVFNGRFPIPIGKYGQGTVTFPVIAGYDAGVSTPSPSATLGTVASSWFLSTTYAGFVCLGGSTNGLTNIQLDTTTAAGTIIYLNSGTPSGGVYDAKLQYPDGALGWTDGANVWAQNLAGTPTLTTGARYEASLIGYYTSGGVGRPLYAFRAVFYDPNIVCSGGSITWNTLTT